MRCLPATCLKSVACETRDLYARLHLCWVELVHCGRYGPLWQHGCSMTLHSFVFVPCPALYFKLRMPHKALCAHTHEQLVGIFSCILAARQGDVLLQLSRNALHSLQACRFNSLHERFILVFSQTHSSL